MFSIASLKQMWLHGWPIMSVLFTLSIFSLAIMLERWVTLRKYDFDRDALLDRVRKFLLEKRKEQAAAYCETLDKPIGRILATVISPSPVDLQAGRDHLERMALRLIRHETAAMSAYITPLGTIGSITPFIGLFGTVIGIMRAFHAIGENAGGGPGVVATGISEALVATALGLLVAIPAVVAYNAFGRKVERITEDMELSAGEVLDLTGARS